MDTSQVPTVLAMLLCDQVIVDAQTNKKSLIGVFENLNAVNFPTTMHLAVYAKLADAEGRYDFKLRMVQLKDESVLSDFEITGAQLTDPLKPVELVINMAEVPVPEPGKYEFQLYANGVYLSRITMEARAIQRPGGS